MCKLLKKPYTTTISKWYTLVQLYAMISVSILCLLVVHDTYCRKECTKKSNTLYNFIIKSFILTSAAVCKIIFDIKCKTLHWLNIYSYHTVLNTILTYGGCSRVSFTVL